MKLLPQGVESLPVTDPVAPVVWHLHGNTRHRRQQKPTLGCFHTAGVLPLSPPLQKCDSVVCVSLIKHSPLPNHFRSVFWKTPGISSILPQLSKEWRTDFFFLAHLIASGRFLESVKRSACVPSQPHRTTWSAQLFGEWDRLHGSAELLLLSAPTK